MPHVLANRIAISAVHGLAHGVKFLLLAFKQAQRGLLALAAWALALMLILVFAGVAMRYLVGSPLAFTEELSGLLLVICFFFAMASSIDQRSDIRITLLSGLLRGRARIWTWRLAEALLVVYLLVFVWQAWKFAQLGVMFKERSEQASLLLWPWKAAILFGLLVAAVAALRSLRADPPAPQALDTDGATPVKL